LKIITITSDNYVANTALLLESLRVWHPDIEVTVYALATGWTAAHARMLTALGAAVQVIPEVDPRRRGGALGQAVHTAFKLDVLREQTQPFVYLDSDILVLQPLDGIFQSVARDGWFSINEGTTLGVYNQGPVGALTQLAADQGQHKSFNAGVIGCIPDRHRDLFVLAQQWAGAIPWNYHGDQGLLNLAWFKLRGGLPPSADTRYNGGWRRDQRIILTQVILHFAAEGYPAPGQSKLEDQTRVWSNWPRGQKITPLTETDFWRDSQPHPWPWVNQGSQRRYRAFVAAMRARSLSLLGTPFLVVDTADQAYLLHARVLADLHRFWSRHAAPFQGLRYRATVHLGDRGVPTSRLGQFAGRWRRTLASWRPG
jgi:hypothetical protein